MARTINATYDPSKVWRPVEEGVYPAHITSLSSKEVHTKAGNAIVVNMEYKMADEVADMSQPVWLMEGYKYAKNNEGNKVAITNGNGVQETASCGHLRGREFKDNGFFIFTEGSSSSKNQKYFKLLENLEVSCEEGSDKVKKLVLLEEEDVVGKPVMVTIKRHEFVTSETKNLPYDQQERRSTFKVSNVVLWDDGTPLTPEELEGDIPF
jgi:hypothetical protein